MFPMTAFDCAGSLEQNCALDIFVGFLIEEVGHIKRILQDTVSVARSEMDDGLKHSPELDLSLRKNSAIEKIIQLLLDADLAVSDCVARSIVVPVFAYHDLLPLYSLEKMDFEADE